MHVSKLRLVRAGSRSEMRGDLQIQLAERVLPNKQKMPFTNEDQTLTETSFRLVGIFEFSTFFPVSFLQGIAQDGSPVEVSAFHNVSLGRVALAIVHTLLKSNLLFSFGQKHQMHMI